NDGHTAAEAAEHLSKFKADVAAPENDQMFGNGLQLHDRSAVEERYIGQAVEHGHRRPGTGIDVELFGGERTLAALFQLDQQRLGSGEARFAQDQFEVGGVLDALFIGVAEFV